MLYLLKFAKPLGSAKHQARYYLGCCEDHRFEERIYEHMMGRGAAITRAAMMKGCFTVVWTGQGSWAEERRLKNWHNHKRILRIQ